jgi:predicted Zn-dependent protease
LNLGLVFLHANETMADLASLGDETVFQLPYSRGEEHQADDGGYDLMTASGYNPTGMVHVFQLLQATQPGGGQPEWMSDHPADKNRISFLQGRIAKDARPFPAETPLPSFGG